MTLVVIGVVVAGSLIGDIASAQDTERPKTQAAMRAVFQSLVDAFNMSQNTTAFADPSNKDEVLRTLRVLSANTKYLEEHPLELDPSFDYIRRSLAADVRAAVQRYEDGEYAASRFLITKLTSNCVACHTKLPSPQEFDLGEEFVQSASVQSQTSQDMLRLQIASRQFDEALRTYEDIFASMSISPTTIEAIGSFEGYLKICIRVERDPQRAKRTLEQFGGRRDVPLSMNKNIKTWTNTLGVLQANGFGGDELTRSRSLIAEGQGLNEFPADRKGLVHFVVASALLHNYVNSKPDSKNDMATAFYQLGVAESYIAVSRWVSETEFYLDRAIRLDPGSDEAMRAYEFLEAYMMRGYSGSSGTQIPEDVQQRLDELRKLAEKGQP
jgi:hypothetical protein